MKKVIVIVGPTGSGKTKYSIAVAKHINGEVINADSVQIFKELNIGSAKIKEEEKEHIIHHLFSIKNVDESYNVFEYQKDVRALLTKIDTPLLVGGTGLYVKAALYDYQFDNEDNSNQYLQNTNEELYEKILAIDPNITVDVNNRRRLVRALNQAESGNLRSEKTNKNVALYDILTIYLDIDRTLLKERLITRLELQLKEGFIEEVKQLKSKNIVLNTIGYRELDQYLSGKISLDEAKIAIINSSMRLAKRQKTWFKNQMDAKIIDVLDTDATNNIIKLVSTFLEE